jgi:hypothetical protein
MKPVRDRELALGSRSVYTITSMHTASLAVVASPNGSFYVIHFRNKMTKESPRK